MLLGFKDQFEPMVLDGTKTHSIREGSRWQVGFRADLYVRPRQKGMRLLFRAPVVRVENVMIWMRSGSLINSPGDRVYCGILGISIADEELTDDEANLLAWNDGFRSAGPVRRDGPLDALTEMAGFWLKGNRLGKTFCGQIIHWDYAGRCVPMTANPFRRGEVMG